MTTEIQPRLIKIRDAAKYLSVGVPVLRRLVQEGRLHFIQLGAPNTPWLFDKSELDTFVEAAKQKI